MVNLSYNLSYTLKERLQKADSLRKDILLTPLSAKIELQMKWDNLINRTYYSLSLTDNSLTKPDVLKILTLYASDSTLSGKLIVREQDVINYKKSLDYITQNWLVTPKNIAVKDVLILYDIFCRGRLVVSQSQLAEVLNYVQANEEHPIIKAGVINIGILRLQPFSQGNGRLSRLLSYLFFYKIGYDIGGLIEFEKSWSQDRQTYLEALRISLEAASITLWLEFFANSLILQLESVLKKIQNASPENLGGINSSFWNLTDRQKSIISMLDQPGLTITNRRVKKHFGISQITASRDLSHLASLGILFTHGKGRSIYYTKV